MSVLAAFIAVSLALVVALLVFVLGSIHVIRCTENAQERFSWASVGRSIRFTLKLAVAALCSVPKALARGVSELYSEVYSEIKRFVYSEKRKD